MKIINKNCYNIMFGLEFLKANEIKEVEDKKLLDMLLSQPGVEEYIDVKDAKKLEEENKELKAQLEKQTKTTAKTATKKAK